MSNRYYTIQIDSIYLTQTGGAPSSSNLRCRTEVDGVHLLQTDYKKTRRADFRGNVIFQKTEVLQKNRDIAITIESLPKAVAESLIALRRTAESTDTPVTLTGTGATLPDFSVSAEITDFEFRDFQHSVDRYRRAVLRFVTFGEAA